MTRITSTPKDDATCGWYHLSHRQKVQPSHSGDSAAKWVVIGAGFTGLAAARQLALNFPDDEIVLIEGQEVGFGTSGRNAGFAIDLPHDIGADDYIGDIATARMSLRLNLLGQNILKGLVAEHGIECHLRCSGKYQAAVEDRGVAVLEAYRKGLDRLGADYEVIDGKQLPDHIGTSFYKQALFTPGTVLIQPSALVKGLADSLPHNVTLHENTVITEVHYGSKTRLVHRDGTLTADRLILANNAFGTHFGFLPRAFLPIFTYGSLTRPLTDAEQQRLGGKAFWGVIPADPFGTTLRRTHDNRILVRNSFSYIADGRARKKYLDRYLRRHEQSFARRFPMLPEVSFEYTWGGGLAMSRNHMGFFGELAPNVFGALGCNGLGITRGTVTGTLLADWLAGRNGDLIHYLLSAPKPCGNPPEPLLTAGVNANLAWGQLRAGQEA
jgi:glycine/D-amino acid oxidase-like deaminating enzyme